MQHDRLLAFSVTLLQKQLQTGQRWLLTPEMIRKVVHVLQYPSQEVLANILTFLNTFFEMDKFKEVFALFSV